MSVAVWLNTILSPTVRKYLHIAVTLVAAIAVIWGMSTDKVSLWVALVVAVGGFGSQVLSAIVAKRADMKVLYVGASGVIVALVAMRFLNPALAGQIDNTLSAIVAAFTGVSFARTDLSTQTGAPRNEVTQPAPVQVPPAPVTAPYAVANPDNSVTVNMGNGSPPVTEGR